MREKIMHLFIHQGRLKGHFIKQFEFLACFFIQVHFFLIHMDITDPSKTCKQTHILLI